MSDTSSHSLKFKEDTLGSDAQRVSQIPHVESCLQLTANISTPQQRHIADATLFVVRAETVILLDMSLQLIKPHDR
jgi:hypothetical protein